MSSQLKMPPLVVDVNKLYRQAPERVYAAWTQADIVRRWWKHTPDQVTHIADIDLRVGGRYRFGMRGADGTTYVVGGEYREIQPNTRLVFTWRWEHSPDEFPTTLVSVDFADHADGCEVRLRHELLPDADQVRKHHEGWCGCLERITTAIAAPTSV